MIKKGEIKNDRRKSWLERRYCIVKNKVQEVYEELQTEVDRYDKAWDIW